MDVYYKYTSKDIRVDSLKLVVWIGKTELGARACRSNAAAVECQDGNDHTKL